MSFFPFYRYKTPVKNKFQDVQEIQKRNEKFQ